MKWTREYPCGYREVLEGDYEEMEPAVAPLMFFTCNEGEARAPEFVPMGCPLHGRSCGAD